MKKTNKRELIEKVKESRRLESNPALIVGKDFPTLHDEARKKVMEELRNRFADPQVQIGYLVEQNINREKLSLARDYMLAESQLGKEGANNFAACMMELRYLSTGPIINERLFKKNILFSIQKGTPVELLHIKSLRYTYPKDGGLKILEDTNENISTGVGDEKRRYPGEDVAFQRLDLLRKLLEYYGVKSSLTIIPADRDLAYLFPENNGLISDSVFLEAQRSSDRYVKFLQKRYPNIGTISSLSDYLKKSEALDEYEEVCKRCLIEAKKGGGDLVTEKLLEMRVNYQYEHYKEMFGSAYTRDLARHTASHQIANLIALSALFKSFSPEPIVVIDGRGFENDLIGSNEPSSRSIFLTKLKDPVEVIE